MFKLFALLFVVTNGVQADKPSGALRYNEKFDTIEACQNYFDGEKGEAAKKALEDRATAEGLGIQFICVPDTSKDHTI